MKKSKWYGLVKHSEKLQQGDFINDLPIITPQLPKANELIGNKSFDVKGNMQTFNVVIMTQSCDLEFLKPSDFVSLCLRVDLERAEKNGKKFNNNDMWNKLTRGQIGGVHLLNRSDYVRHGFDYQIVDLGRIISVPYSFIYEFAKNSKKRRVRLLSPYREHLAQAFARQFMRIGLPIDLPKKYTPPKKNE